MFKSCLFIIGLVIAMASGCGKGEEQAEKAGPKTQPQAKANKESEPSPPSDSPAPIKDAKTSEPVENAEDNQTTGLAEEIRFLESLRPQHEGKPSTLKIELEKLRAKGEPVTLKELDAWYKAVPPAKNPALAFVQTTNAVPKNGADLWVAVDREKDRHAGDFPIRVPAMRTKVRAYLVAHQALSDQLFAMAQRYPANQPARFPIDCTRGPSTPLPQLTEIRKANWVLMWRSKYFATQKTPPVAQGQNPSDVGYQQQAVSSILVLLRICHLLDGEPYLISSLVQIANAGSGREALETLLNMRTLTDPQLVSLQQSFASFNWPQQMANALVGERASYLGIEQIARTGTKEQVQWIDPSEGLLYREILYRLRLRTEAERNLEMTTFINMMNKLIEGVRKGYPGVATLDDEDSPFQTTWNRFSKLIKSDRYNKAYFYTSILLPSSRLLGRMHKASASQQFATSALAIERYRLANQWRLPKTLQELIPNYLVAHPFDPYTGKPLTYLPKANGAYELRAEKSKDPPVRFKVNPANRLR